jgi:hypothetical protein
MHLSLPNNGKLSQANILVPFTRPSVWSQIKLLAPLWPEGDYLAKQKFVATVLSAFNPPPKATAKRMLHNEYLTEMARMHDLAANPTMTALYLSLMGRQMPKAIECQHTAAELRQQVLGSEVVGT